MARSGKQFKIGLSLDEAKPLLGKKVMLNPRQIRKALSIVGIGQSGIKNLSESVHEYRRMAKSNTA
jgi:hypothetical protein